MVADVRCLRCGEWFLDHKPPCLAEAAVQWIDGKPEVVLAPKRRRSRKELAGAPRSGGRRGRVVTGVKGVNSVMGAGRTTDGKLVRSRDQRAVPLPCRGCRLPRIDVVLADLLPWLLAGYAEIRVGANGEVVPIGVPRRRAGSGSGSDPSRLQP